MKTPRRLFALLLVLGMFTVLLTGCSDDTQRLIGSWKTTLSMADAGEDMDGLEQLQEFMDISTLKIDMSVVFNEDGTFSMSITPESAAAAVDTMLEQIKPYMEKMLTEQLAAEGLDMTLEEFFTMTGTSLDELIEQSLDREEAINAMVEGGSREGRYKAANGKLYFSESKDQEPDETEYEPFSFEGETLLITEDMGGNQVQLRLERVK